MNETGAPMERYRAVYGCPTISACRATRWYSMPRCWTNPRATPPGTAAHARVAGAPATGRGGAPGPGAPGPRTDRRVAGGRRRHPGAGRRAPRHAGPTSARTPGDGRGALQRPGHRLPLPTGQGTAAEDRRAHRSDRRTHRVFRAEHLLSRVRAGSARRRWSSAGAGSRGAGRACPKGATGSASCCRGVRGRLRPPAGSARTPQHLAADRAGRRLGEPGHRFGDVLRQAALAHGVHPPAGLADGQRNGGGHLRLDEARRHRVDGDAALAQRRRQAGPGRSGRPCSPRSCSARGCRRCR